MLRKLFTIILAAAMTLSVMVYVNAASEIVVKVDGTAISLDVAPVIDSASGRTMVPIRAVAEALGGEVQWDGATQTATISTVDNEIEMTIGQTTATVNGVSKTLDAPAKNIGGRTMLPLRFVGESLGATVGFDQASRTVTIDYFSKMSGTLKIGGSTTVQPIFQAAADKLKAMNPSFAPTVAGGGSGVGLSGVSDGTLNIGGYSTDLTAASRTQYPTVVDTQIGSDGVAIMLNPANKVKNLTKQQVYDIFTGKITNWKDVGGDDQAIFVMTRESTSGTLDAFNKLALIPMGTSKMVSTATPYASSGLILQAVAGNKNAIGFESFGYALSTNTVATPTVDGVSATNANAISKKWAYVRPLNVLTKGNPSGVSAAFINYLLSPNGQKLIQSLNYLPLKVED